MAAVLLYAAGAAGMAALLVTCNFAEFRLFLL